MLTPLMVTYYHIIERKPFQLRHPSFVLYQHNAEEPIHCTIDNHIIVVSSMRSGVRYQ